MNYLNVLFWLVFISNSLFASGSMGGRGGGTGVLCGDEVFILEEFELIEENALYTIPKTREEIESLMKAKLANHKNLFQDWRKIWSKNGTYFKWNLFRVENISNLAKNLKLPFLDSEYDRLEYDTMRDFLFEKKTGCKLIPLAKFINKKVYKHVHSESLFISERLARLIELHESLFILGSDTFGHIFSTKTRELLKAILSNDAAGFSRSVNDFKTFNVNIDKVGFFKLHRQLQFSICPVLKLILSETDLGSLALNFKKSNNNTEYKVTSSPVKVIVSKRQVSSQHYIIHENSSLIPHKHNYGCRYEKMDYTVSDSKLFFSLMSK